MLGVSPSQVIYLAKIGRIAGQATGGRWEFEIDSLRTEASDRELWISYLNAADLTGSDHHAVWRAVQAGEIERRDVHRARPSLLRSSVIDWGERRAIRLETEARVRIQAQSDRATRGQPPSADHVWLGAPVVAIMLGVTTSAVDAAARRGSIPHEMVGRRRWFRRDHVERLSAARAAMKNQDVS